MAMTNNTQICEVDGITPTPIRQSNNHPGHLSTAGPQVGEQEMTEKFNDILNVQQVAEILGITEKAVYNMTSKRQIPFCKPNRKCIYFLESDIREWILNSRVKPDSEIETIAATKTILRGE